ncbi:methyltransferase domain-containing protein [Patescibacteria group bacterium]|nr:methyltransferase domain-containing protein [Patescibacteria group bacterium]
MGLLKNFGRFSPHAYLSEHYNLFTREERFALRFLHESYATFGRKNVRVLEIGGGPTVYQLVSASKYAQSIIFTDFLEKNLETVRMWVAGRKSVKDWSERFRYVAGLERNTTPKTIEKRLRSKLKQFRTLDILAPHSPLKEEKFDVVSSHFCAESITNSTETFKKAMRFIASHVAPGGMLVMSFLKEARSYADGEKMYAAHHVNEKVLRTTIKRLGCTDIEIHTIDVEEDGERNAVICLKAYKKRRHTSRK